MKSFAAALILALVARWFIGNFAFDMKDTLLALGVGALIITPAVYALFSSKVHIAGGIYTKESSPLVFYSVTLFSGFLGAFILALPINIGL